VAVTENLDNVEISSDYIVTPALDTETWNFDEGFGIKTVSDTIRQGETNLHEKIVSNGLTLLVVDLDWGDSTDSVRLKIYTPGGSVLGPYYDNADDTIDGRIQLDIRNPNGIETGTWIYEVYGYRVDETEDYTI
jgi:hypothetical protein